jgi:hypothetical protein
MYMKPGKDIEQRIEQTLNSLDGIQRAEPQPWLFSRIKSRLAREEDKTIWGTLGSFLAKPSIAIAGLCFILLLNGILLFRQEKEAATVAITEQALDSESLIASSSSFDYENLVQP